MTCKDCIETLKRIIGKLDWELYAKDLEALYMAIDVLKKLEQQKFIELPCKVGDVLYDVVLCDDEKYRIFEMKVADISPFGTLYSNSKVCEPFIWNLYLVEKYSYAYRMFKDIGQTVFFEKSKAESKLKELKENENA